MKEYWPEILMAFITVVLFELFRRYLWEKLKDNYGSTIECTPITGMIGWGVAYRNGCPDEQIFVYEKDNPLMFERSVSNLGFLPIVYRYYCHLNYYEPVKLDDFYYHPSELGNADEKVKYHYLYSSINGKITDRNLYLMKRHKYESNGEIVLTNKKEISINSKGLNSDHLLFDFKDYGFYDFNIVLEYKRRNEIKTVIDNIKVLYLDTDMDRLREESFKRLNDSFR